MNDTTTDDVCECPTHRGSGDMSVCMAEADSGRFCTRPESHQGPHSACTVSQHPVEAWEKGAG